MSGARKDTTAEALVIWAVKDMQCLRYGGAVSSAEIVQQLEWLRGRYGQTTDGAAYAGRLHAMGCFVDSFGPQVRVNLDPDAEAIFRRLMALPISSRFLVIDNARKASRPNDSRGIPPLSLKPVLCWTHRDDPGYAWDNGSWRWRRAGYEHWPQLRRSNLDGEGAVWCELREEDRRSEIFELREIYSNWWRGLRQVLWHFQANPHELRRWRVKGVGAPRPVDL